MVRAGEAVWLQIGPSTSNQSVAIRWINDAGQQFGNIITLAGNTRVSLVPPAELRGWALLVVEEERERRVFRVRVL